MNHFVIDLEHIWKKYPAKKDRPGFKEFMVNFYKLIYKKRNHVNSDFYAIRDLTLKIKKGECIGIIGQNGAGKSTLLSIILGTILPSKGRVTVLGRVTPLLELGAGFHQDLTGRENIILNGILLGMTKLDVLRKMDTIIRFSELEEFIDLPVRTYSSGMYLRLAFSVAIHTDPKILIVDEVLSVGDERFQKKSKEVILKLIKGGITTVFVSHNLKDIEEICNRALWLRHGQVIAEGEPRMVTERYKKEMNKIG
ncbi:MAG: ABC transporter ATP-binding protein [Deltaproteobacteria bacterium]|nr:ABC transporter ATP-binding protein [Deltaproteobacteria bacterium]